MKAHRPRLRPAFSRAFALLGLSALACNGALPGEIPGGEQLGTVNALLSVVPANVSCVRVIDTVGLTTTRKNFSVTPGASDVVLNLGQLALGTHAFNAVAGPQACAPGNLPTVTWSTTYEETVEVVHASQLLSVALLLSPQPAVSTTIDFQPVVKSLEMTASGTVALLDNGEIHHFGAGVSPTPVPHSGFSGTFTQIAVGRAHECALTTDGQVFCRGDNSKGQLGLGFAVGSTDDALRVTMPVSDAVVQIEAAADATCVRTSADELYCFGDNSQGKLGVAPGRGSLHLYTPTAPAAFGTARVRDIAMGNAHTCFRTERRQVYCAGANDMSQLGRNNVSAFEAQFDSVLGAFGVVALFAGLDTTCARRADGEVACWGQFAGPAPASNTPTVVPAFKDAKTIALGQGFLFGCAAFPGGPPQCWSGGSYSWNGVRGNGEEDDGVMAPVIGMIEANQIDAAEPAIGALCAVDRDGVAFCWGSNQRGHLGNNSPDSAFYPTRVIFP